MSNNEKLFKSRFREVYVHENSEDEDDIYNWEHFYNTCVEGWNNHEDILVDSGFEDLDSFVNYVVANIDWQYPETLIEDLINFD